MLVTKRDGNDLGFLIGGNRWLDRRVEHVGQALERPRAACIRCPSKAVGVEPNQIRAVSACCRKESYCSLNKRVASLASAIGLLRVSLTSL